MKDFLIIICSMCIGAGIFEYLNEPQFERFDIQELEPFPAMELDRNLYYIRTNNLIGGWVYVDQRWSEEEVEKYIERMKNG